MEKRYYLAYGSNLNVRQMMMRCPSARIIGTATIKDYKLMFKGSQTGSYLTIEPAPGSEVPVGVWDVSAADERALDRYEGYPSFYYKKELTLEFPEMYDHIDKLESYIGIPITRLKSEKPFEYYFLEHSPKRKNPALAGRKGFSWAGPRNRWCTAVLKTRIIDAHLAKLANGHDIVQYIGIAADEPNRVRDKRYPLVEWGMTEADCLTYCKERGFEWGGLYDIFTRVSCWCCPLQSFDELRRLRAHFPDLWKQLMEWDQQTWRTFLKHYSVQQLDTRFAFEEECLSQGLPIKGRAFFTALKERLKECE